MNLSVKRNRRSVRNSRFSGNLYSGIGLSVITCTCLAFFFVTERLQRELPVIPRVYRNFLVEKSFNVTQCDTSLNTYVSYLAPLMYQAYYDSLFKLSFKPGTREYYLLKCQEQMNGVLKSSIVRYDSLKKMKVMIYLSSVYDRPMSAYWIAVSYDRGQQWKYFYTGLAKCWPWYIKSESSIPLIINDSTLEVEAAEMKLVEMVVLPDSPTGQYGLKEDGFKISFRLNEIMRDSDEDGLTDIVESKFLTDPANPDTDNDGLADSKDSNPRFKSIRNDYTVLMRHFLEGPSSVFFNPSKRYPEKREASGDVYMIYSDEKIIQHLPQTRNTYIIVTEEDLNTYNWKIELPCKRLYINEIKSPDEFNVSTGGDFWGSDYHVTQYKNGWKIEERGGYII